MGTENDYVRMAYDSIFHRDFVGAINHFRRAIEQEPETASHYYKLSVTYSRNNQLREAIRVGKEALRIEPECRLYKYHLDMLYSRKYCYHALACMERRRVWKPCIYDIRRAIRLDPLNGRAFLLYAVMLEHLGYRNQAIDSLKKVLELEPEQREAKQMLKKMQS